MKPGHYSCGAGCEINCEYFDSVDGCLKGCKEVFGVGCVAESEEDFIRRIVNIHRKQRGG